MNAAEMDARLAQIRADAEAREAKDHEERAIARGTIDPLLLHEYRRGDRLLYENTELRGLCRHAGWEMERLEREAKTSIPRRQVQDLLAIFASDYGPEMTDEGIHSWMREHGYFQDELAGVTNG